MSATTTYENQMTLEQQVERDALARRIQFANTVTTYLIGAGTFMLIVIVILWAFLNQFNQLVAFGGVLLPMVAGCLFYKYLAGQQKLTAGFLAFEMGFILTVFAAAFVIPGILAAVGLAYLLIIMFTYLLHSSKAGRWVSIWPTLNYFVTGVPAP